MIGRLYRTTLALCLTVLTALAPVAPAFAQQQTGQPAPPQGQTAPTAQVQSPNPDRTIQISNQKFTRGQSWFPNVIAPYTPVTVPEPVLTNAPRIEQMVQNGKLMLSLQDAIDLALQNNLDLLIQRYGPWIAEANIVRTKGGGASRGTYAVTGAPLVNFDPAFTSTLSLDQKLGTVNNPLLSGTGGAASVGLFSTLATHTAIGNIAYSQEFHTGTTVTATFNNTRASTSATTNFFDPSITSQMIIVASQPLLRGFGLTVNESNIHVAILSKKAADLSFQQQMITSMTAVADAYWELVFARDNVDVAKATVALADKTYSDNKKQVDIGTLAPLEIVQAEAQVATANQQLVVAQTTVLQDQIALLNLITKNQYSPALLNVEVIPTDTANNPPPPVEQVPLTDALKEAITKRPDVLTAAVTIKADNISVKTSRNELLPTLNLSAEFASQGLAGIHTNTCSPTPCTPPPPGVSGLGTALNDELTGIYPEYNAQLTLNIPIRNRQAQADNVQALLTQRQDQSRYQQTLNNASVDVQNAQITLAQDRVIVDAAVKTRDLDQQTLDAEQKKYQLGASTLFNIVTDQNTLAAAASAEVRARVNLVEAKVNFDRAMGRTIETYNITIADTNAPHVYKDSLIPGTSSTGELLLDGIRNTGSSSAGNGQ